MHGFEPWTFRVLDGCSNQLSYINTDPARVDYFKCAIGYLTGLWQHSWFQEGGCMPPSSRVKITYCQMPECRRESGFRLESKNLHRIGPRSSLARHASAACMLSCVCWCNISSLTLLECSATLAVRVLFAHLFPPG